MIRHFNSWPLAASRIIALCCALGVSIPTAWAASGQGVLLSGYNVQFGSAPAAISDSALDRDTLCAANGAASMLNLFNQVGDRLQDRLGTGGISASERQQEVRAAISELCATQEAFSVDAYAMTYSDCRMTMDTASILTDINLPRSESFAVMSISDFYRAETSRMTFDRRQDASDGMAAMNISDVTWIGPGHHKRIAGYPATRWEFHYEGGMGLGGEGMAGLEALGLSATFTSSGYGYYSTDAPGMGIAQAFFEKFSSQVQANDGSLGMFGGMLNTMVDMLAKGMPLEMEQMVQTSMGGRSLDGMRSRMKATGLRMVGLPGDFCDRHLVPDHFTVSDMNEELGGLSGSAPGGRAGAAGTEGIGQAMSEFNKVMEQMSPEQREAMKDIGLGSMFGGDSSEDNPSGQAARQQAPAGTGSSSGGLPSSASLTTNDLTQSVQNHLQALGYSVGNTNGNLDTDTVIAISQFQAEKGMDVTGEVSPQLLGILGAEVDSR